MALVLHQADSPEDMHSWIKAISGAIVAHAALDARPTRWVSHVHGAAPSAQTSSQTPRVRECIARVFRMGLFTSITHSDGNFWFL
ncbi:unnamed protein product [Tetraodon nigroviridis]|uniref:(spotted green pufferfish) hypothetical protein n=1 Tax=Tetraodon nigroviridis TaxID=99883 RepID=Q4TEP7_TETNG|nr:unnamed protein product [Tetraodon nigroviridis]